jgi:hypothetical protein
MRRTLRHVARRRKRVVPRGVSDSLHRAARWLLHRPGVQLLIGAAVIAVAFPASAAGSIAMAILAGGFGVGVARGWRFAPELVRAPSPGGAALFACALVAVVGVVAFWEVMTTSPDWQQGDWGPQHAALAGVMHALPGLHVPVWNHLVQTGDAPLELYPAAAYLATGHVAVALGLEQDLPLAFMIVAVVVHLGLAVLTTAIAARIAPWPLAVVVGIASVVDSGAISHGGTVGLFHWALFHSAFAHVFSTIAALGILHALRKPSLGASIAIWIGTAIGTASHPAALIMAAACALALVLVAIVAEDIPPRRALAALFHVALGCALGAIVWMPAAARMLEYGQHFSNELRSGTKLLVDVLSWASPITSYSLLVYTGYVGVLVGLWSRRGEVMFVAALTLIMLLGMWDAPYLAFGLAPSETIARLGATRLMLLSRPFTFAIAAYGLAIVFRAARDAWRGASPRQQMVSAALIGVIACVTIRIAPQLWRGEVQRATDEARQFAPDKGGRLQLESWAMQQVKTITPDHWARALFEQDTHEHLHLTAETGLPTLHLTHLPDMLLRERIEDASPESLRRFDVRWVVAYDKSPSLGEPATEQTFGDYHVRELAAWDGRFARVEKGSGDVTVTRLDDQEVDVVVTAKAPVLVALGTGYYPRWRATHASGADEPVFALPSIDGGVLHVVSAWLAPGTTVFTCDGPLPSDGMGRVPAFGALAICLLIIVAWSHRRTRGAVLRQLAAIRAHARSRLPWAAPIGIPLVLGVLWLRGCHDTNEAVRALRVGSGVRATATVEARVGTGAWEDCGYDRVVGEYRCDGIATVSDVMGQLMTDAYPSWNYTTPAIAMSADVDDVQVRVTIPARMAGRYWAATGGAKGTLALAADAPPDAMTDLSSTRATVDAPERGDQDATITLDVATGPQTEVSVVRVDTIEPPRAYLVPPPEAPPASVLAIHR